MPDAPVRFKYLPDLSRPRASFVHLLCVVGSDHDMVSQLRERVIDLRMDILTLVNEKLVEPHRQACGQPLHDLFSSRKIIIARAVEPVSSRMSRVPLAQRCYVRILNSLSLQQVRERVPQHVLEGDKLHSDAEIVAVNKVVDRDGGLSASWTSRDEDVTARITRYVSLDDPKHAVAIEGVLNDGPRRQVKAEWHL